MAHTSSPRRASLAKKAKSITGGSKAPILTPQASNSPSAQLDRVVNPAQNTGDEDLAQRPKRLQDFIGQKHLTDQLKIALDAARRRGQPIDPVLFTGPPGLGKTTLASIIASEQGFGFHAATAPAISRSGGEMAAILVNLPENSVFFLDEIHRLSGIAAEMLYTAMEDRHIDLIIGEGSATKTVRLGIKPFTLVGATTRPGSLPAPFRARFGISLRLDFYSPQDLAIIVANTADALEIQGDKQAWLAIAARSRGTPRIAKRLLRRVRDYADAHSTSVSVALVDHALAILGIEEDGLESLDRRYMEALADYAGKPAGVNAIAVALQEDPDMLETGIEPFLVQHRLIQRTPQGRILTARGLMRLRKNPLSIPTEPQFEIKN